MLAWRYVRIIYLVLSDYAKKNLKGTQACQTLVTKGACRSFRNLFEDCTKGGKKRISRQPLRNTHIVRNARY
jgi:hypothetical protein